MGGSTGTDGRQRRNHRNHQLRHYYDNDNDLMITLPPVDHQPFIVGETRPNDREVNQQSRQMQSGQAEPHVSLIMAALGLGIQRLERRNEREELTSLGD